MLKRGGKRKHSATESAMNAGASTSTSTSASTSTYDTYSTRLVTAQNESKSSQFTIIPKRDSPPDLLARYVPPTFCPREKSTIVLKEPVAKRVRFASSPVYIDDQPNPSISDTVDMDLSSDCDCCSHSGSCNCDRPCLQGTEACALLESGGSLSDTENNPGTSATDNNAETGPIIIASSIMGSVEFPSDEESPVIENKQYDYNDLEGNINTISMEQQELIYKFESADLEDTSNNVNIEEYEYANVTGVHSNEHEIGAINRSSDVQLQLVKEEPIEHSLGNFDSFKLYIVSIDYFNKEEEELINIENNRVKQEAEEARVFEEMARKASGEYKDYALHEELNIKMECESTTNQEEDVLCNSEDDPELVQIEAQALKENIIPSCSSCRPETINFHPYLHRPVAIYATQSHIEKNVSKENNQDVSGQQGSTESTSKPRVRKCAKRRIKRIKKH